MLRQDALIEAMLESNAVLSFEKKQNKPLIVTSYLYTLSGPRPYEVEIERVPASYKRTSKSRWQK